MIDDLHHLIRIVEAGTFTAAARHAHLSQPALTAAMHRLEETAGARLLERDRRGARLTPAGAAFLPHARAAVASLAYGIEAVAQLRGLSYGQVRLGAGATACTWMLPPMLATFRRAHQGIHLALLEATTTEVLQGIVDRRLDLGVVTAGDALPAGVVVEPWRVDRLVVVAKHVRCDVEPWVAFHRGSPTRASLDLHEPEAVIAAELGNIGAVLAFVRAGMGRALVSLAAVERDLERGDLVQLHTAWTPMTRQLQVAHRGRGLLSAAASALLQRLLGPAS